MTSGRGVLARQWTAGRLAAVSAAAAAAAGLVALLVPVLFGTPRPMVHVTWQPIDASIRAGLERTFQLTEPRPLPDGTWAYVPLETDRDTLRAIVTHPAVADTDGIDRARFEMAARPPLTPRRGGLWAAAPRWGAPAAVALAGVLGVLAAAAGLLALVRHADWSADSAAAGVRLVLWPGIRRAIGSVWRSPAVDLVIVAVVGGFRFLSLDYFENDHFTYLTFAHQITFGELPVRDFDDPGFPLMLWLSAAAMWAGGVTLLPEAVMTAAMLGLAAGATSRATWLATGSRSIGVGAAALQLVAHPRLYGYPKILVPALAAWMFFRYGRRPTPARLAALAAVAAFAGVLRHDMLVYVAAATGVLLVITHGWTRAMMRRAAAWAGLTALFALPYLAYLAVFGVERHLRSTLDFSRAEMARTADWGVLLRSESPLTFGLILLPLVAAAWVLAQRWRQGRWGDDAAAVLATAVMLAVAELALMRDATPSRVLDLFGPAPILAAWLVAAAFGAARQVPGRGVRTVAAAALSAAVAAGAVSVWRHANFGHHLREARVADGWGAVRGHAERQLVTLQQWPWTGAWQGSDDVARYLAECTAPDARVLVIGFRPEVPFVARRMFAGGHSWLLPGYVSGAANQQRMAAWLAADPPAVIVVDPVEGATFRTDFPAIAAILGEYHAPRTVPGLDVYVSRTLPVSGTHAGTGLPCHR
jgi:hypothetical protein